MRLGARLRSTPVRLLLAAALPVTLLAGCGDDDGAEADGAALPALGFLPADSTTVSYTDRAGMAERLGVDDIDPRAATDADVQRYVDAIRDVGWGTTLTPYVRVDADAPLNELDIDWEATAAWGSADDGGRAVVWKLGDAFDLDAFTADLEDIGYDEASVGDLTTYTTDLSSVDPGSNLIGGHYPPTMLGVLLDPDDDVVATGDPDSLSTVAAVISGDEDSLVDDGGFDDLAGLGDGDPEHLALARGDSACPSPAPSGDPSALEQLESQYGDLGHPEGRGTIVSGDDAAVQFALQFADSDAAAADLAAREDLVSGGTDPRTQQPFGDLGTFDLSQDGALVTIHADLENGAAALPAFESTGGGPAFCLPAT